MTTSSTAVPAPTAYPAAAGFPSAAEQRAAGRALRETVPRSELARLSDAARAPLDILAEQNATRLPDLIPLRAERMAASPFAFYRGTAALMAADLAADPSSGITVASCGDAHVANLGFYASHQRSLVFDLNDFDEVAWAPWEWDVKRLVTSVVIGGRATGRSEEVVRDAAGSVVRSYATALAAHVERSPLQRYYEHFQAEAADGRHLDAASRAALQAAIADADRRTAERAVRRLTERDERGRLRFVERPPTMQHLPRDEERARLIAEQYAASTHVDVQVLLSQYRIVDACLRVVGVGSVGTRCYLLLYQDGDGNALVLQAKEAGRSVLEQYGGVPLPAGIADLIARQGEGARVVSGQRVLQGVSDPLLGYLRSEGHDYYVRQFHDRKGGIDVETLTDAPFARYAQACGIVLARAHAQSARAAEVAGYLGAGRRAAEAITSWALAYAEVSRADFEAFRATPASS